MPTKYIIVNILFFLSNFALIGQITLNQNHTNASVGLDRKNWNNGSTAFHSQGYHHDFTLPAAPNPCSKITSIEVTVSLSNFINNPPPGCTHTEIYYNVFYGCNTYSGGASCPISNMIGQPNFPPNTSLPTQTYGCPLPLTGQMANFGGNLSVDIIPVYLPGCNPNWQSAVSMGFVGYQYDIEVVINFDNISCAGTGCLAPGAPVMLPCDDNNPCTINDTQGVLACDNAVVCVPCAGTPNPAGGLTVSAVATQPICGQNNGSILVSPGPAGHTYAWTGGLSGNNPTGLAPGTYTVTVTDDNNGCTGTATTILNISNSITASAVLTQTTCGQNNGSISVSPGPAGHTYDWTGGLVGQNPLNVGPGTYTVTVTQTSTGCTDEETVTINPSMGISSSSTLIQPTCGQNNGSISISPGPTGHTYNWTGGLNGQNPVNVSPGTYTVTVTQVSNGCTAIETVILDPSVGVNVSLTPVPTSCGLNNGIIDVQPGPVGYNYSWTGGLNGQNPMNVSSGTYTVTVTEISSGCTGTESVMIDPSNVLTISISETQPSCGLNNGSILVSPGPAGYDYDWTGGLAGNNPINLGAGTYTVTVTETSTGCTSSESIVLVSSGNLTVVATETQPTCGQNNGSISVSPGPTGFTYTWSGGLMGQNPMNVAPGTYTVTVTQTSNGCTGTDVSVITASSSLTVVATETQPTCGQNNGSISVSPGPTGFTYVWSGGLMGQNPMNVAPGTYTVTITQTSNGCTGTTSVTLNASGNLTVVATPTQPSCGQNNGSISVSPGPAGHTYAWSGGLMGQNPMNVAPGTYTVTITQTSNGCTGTTSVTLNASGNLTVVATPTQPSCGQNNGSISVSPGPAGHTYAWTGGITGQSPMNIAPGTYTVTVTQTSNGCTGTTSVTLNASGNLTVVATPTQPSCGQNNGSISVSPGPAGHTYAWTGGITGQSPMNIAPGTYTVTVTQTSNGCTGTTSVTLNASGNLTVVATPTQPSCGQNNGSISVSPGPAGHTYAWTGGLTGQNPMNIAPGTYTVTVTQTSNGCTGATSVTLNASGNLTVVATPTQPSCGQNNGSISVSPGPAGHTYAWTGGLTGQNPMNIAPGTYTVTVTQTSNGCTGATSVTLNTSSILTVVSTINQPSCGQNNGSISVSPGPAGHTYAWTGGLNGQNPVNIAPGTYTVTVTQTSNGCTGSTSVTMNASSNLTVVATPIQPSCGKNNGSISVSPGPAGHTYAWTGGLTGQNPMNIAPGTYTVTVTQTSNGCTGATSVTLNTSSILTVVTTINQPSCGQNNGSISVSPGPAGHTYAWTGGLVGQNPMNIAPGTYTVTVTQTNNGCTGTATTTLVGSQSLNITCTPTPVSGPTSSDGRITINMVNGSQPYIISWNGGNAQNIVQNTYNISNLSSGNFNITVTDSKGCIATCQSSVLNADCKLEADVTTEITKCFGSNDGKITLTIRNAGGNPSIIWSNPEWNGQTNISNALANTYSVTITDNLGCQIIKNAVVSQPPVIDLVCNGSPVSAKGKNDGVCNVSISGGSPNYAIRWSGPSSGQNLNNAPGLVNIPSLSAGNYVLTVTDVINCTSTCSFIIEDKPCSLSVKAEVKNPTCYEICDGEISLNIEGFVNKISSISWNNPAWEDKTKVDMLCSGLYRVTVVDDIGCSASLQSISVVQPDSIKVTITSTTLNPLADLEFTLNLVTNINPNDITSIVWSNNNFLDCDNCIQPKGKITENTTFIANVVSAQGCKGSGLINLTVRQLNTVYFPNIISNSSAGNSKFFPSGNKNNIKAVDYLTIYDRWGNLVFEKKNFEVNNPDFGWNGSFLNAEVTPGVYFYVAQATFLNDEIKIFKGDITVFR